MHNFLYSFFIAFANNIDNISARVAYSVRGIKISNLINLWISAITFIISASAAYLGSAVSSLVSSRFCSIFSMLLLTALGLWTIAEPFFKKPKADPDQIPGQITLWDILNEPERADLNHSKDIDFKEATLLGIALSINNIGGSFSAGMLRLNFLFIGLLSALISFAALWLGNCLTALIVRRKVGRKATIIAGIVLIAIGIKQLF